MSGIEAAELKASGKPSDLGEIKRKKPSDPAGPNGILMVGVTGFEPATSSSRTKRASQAALHPDRRVWNLFTESGWSAQEGNLGPLRAVSELERPGGRSKR